jgi:hypothetical protein
MTERNEDARAALATALCEHGLFRGWVDTDLAVADLIAGVLTERGWVVRPADEVPPGYVREEDARASARSARSIAALSRERLRAALADRAHERDEARTEVERQRAALTEIADSLDGPLALTGEGHEECIFRARAALAAATPDNGSGASTSRPEPTARDAAPLPLLGGATVTADTPRMTPEDRAEEIVNWDWNLDWDKVERARTIIAAAIEECRRHALSEHPLTGLVVCSWCVVPDWCEVYARLSPSLLAVGVPEHELTEETSHAE